MDTTITTNKAEYQIFSYPSNIEIYCDHDRVAHIECTGDSPVVLSGRKYTRGTQLALAINKWNIKKLLNRM